MTDESRPTGEPEYEDREDAYKDESADDNDKAMPLLLLWEQEQSRVHPGLWEALDTLVEAGCKKHRVIYLLMRIPEADFIQNTSKDDIRTTLADLSRAVKALERLRTKQIFPLLGPLAHKQWSMLQWLQRVKAAVEKLEKSAHGGKSLLVDHLKAALVWHVIDATGQPHDSEVSNLLEAVAESIWNFDDVGHFTRNEPGPWGFPFAENHRKWRALHAVLIDEDVERRQAWLREADAEGQQVAEWLKCNRPSPARRSEALKLKADGARWEEIAARFDMAVPAVKKWLGIG